MNTRIARLTAVLLGVAVHAAADQPLAPSSRGGPAAKFSDSPAKPESGRRASSREAKVEKYLLLDDETIVAGIVVQADSHYVVERKGAKVLFPTARVLCVGDALEDLYRYQAERVPIGDIELRSRLAQWCFDQGLFSLARSEAEHVLKMDAACQAAARVVRLCDARMQPPDEEVAHQGGSQARRPRQPDPGRVVAQFKAAYGQDLFNEYRSFEGRLVASCGSAACHGSPRHEGAFRIYRRNISTVEEGAPRMDIKLTSRNLLSLLDAIDYQEPLRSPVLFKALERHGASSLPPLGGVQDPTYVRLQEWVLEVSSRWSSNEIEVDPRRLEPAGEADSDDEFAASRRKAMESIQVRRTGRPEEPVLEPGDAIAKRRLAPPLTDDAPPQEEPASDEPVSLPMEEDEFEPSRPVKPKRRLDPNSIMDSSEGKPRVRQSIKLAGPKKGTIFEAAAPPISLRSDLDEVKESKEDKVK